MRNVWNLATAPAPHQVSRLRTSGWCTERSSSGIRPTLQGPAAKDWREVLSPLMNLLQRKGGVVEVGPFP